MNWDREAMACSSGDGTCSRQAKQVPVLDVRALFGESREVRLRHCSEEYRLLLTRNNRLLLTK